MSSIHQLARALTLLLVKVALRVVKAASQLAFYMCARQNEDVDYPCSREKTEQHVGIRIYLHNMWQIPYKAEDRDACGKGDAT